MGASKRAIKADGGGDVAPNKGNASHKSIKNQIRSFRRVLMNPHSNSEMKASVEAKIAELVQKRATVAKLNSQKEMHSKYKRVRLFERRKVIRTIENLKKRIDTAEGDDIQLQDQLKDAYSNLNYIKNFPFGQKYIALFPKGGHKDPQALEKINEIRTMLTTQQLQRKEEQHVTELNSDEEERSNHIVSRESHNDLDEDDFFE